MTITMEPSVWPNAGLELDILIQTRVFGTKTIYCRNGEVWNGVPLEHPSDRAFYIPSDKPWSTHSIDAIPVPHYSTRREAAMDVFFQMVMWHGHAEISCDMEDYGREPGDIVTVAVGLDDVWYHSGELAESICKAALASMAGSKDEDGEGTK